MAKRTVVELIDDLDGSEASQTVRFALDGAEYEIDLNEENAGSLQRALEPFVSAARKTAGTTRRQSPASSTPSVDTKDVRRWAAENGIAVNSRGRISTDVIERYLATR